MSWTGSPGISGPRSPYVPFPAPLRETLALHIAAARADGAVFLLEPPRKKPYSALGPQWNRFGR